MPLIYECKTYYISSYLLHSEGVKHRDPVVQCYRGSRIKYHTPAFPIRHAVWRIMCYLDNAILSFKPFVTFSHNGNQMHLECFYCWDLYLKMDLELTAENISFWFVSVIKSVIFQRWEEWTKVLHKKQTGQCDNTYLKYI